LWDEKGAQKIRENLETLIVNFIAQKRVIVAGQGQEQALLQAYISEWRKFFTQSSFIPLPFWQLETSLQTKTSSSNNNSSSTGKKSVGEESIVRKLMLDSWNESIFVNVKDRLQESAMKIIQAERNGEAFDSQLVIGVRESYVNLCSNNEDKLKIYKDNFENAYLNTTSEFYCVRGNEYLQKNGVKSYMQYADSKLREEESRAQRYLESVSISALSDCCVRVLIKDHLPTLLVECKPLIESAETEKLNLMFRLLDRVGAEGVEPMLNDLENHIVAAGLNDMISCADVITTDSEKYVERLLDLFKKFR
jgi:cullin-5